MSIPDPHFVVRNHELPRIAEEAADWGSERDHTGQSLATFGKRDLVRGVVAVLLALIFVSGLFLWVTGRLPFAQAHAGQVTAIFADGFETPDETPIDVCALDPLIMPAGWPVDTKTWTVAFSGHNNNSPKVFYPRGPSWPVDEGAQKGRYTDVPFIPNVRQSVLAYYDQVQSRPQDGYFRPRPARTMLIGISPCPGDLRPPTYGALDVYASPRCRIISNGGALVWSTDPAQIGTCPVIADRTYFLTFAAVNTMDGLQTDEHTCEDVPSAAQGCDVGIVFSTGPAGQ